MTLTSSWTTLAQAIKLPQFGRESVVAAIEAMKQGKVIVVTTVREPTAQIASPLWCKCGRALCG